MDRHEQLTARARQGFRAAFGILPARLVAAPGRVNLIGDDVDTSEGYVLSCAIDRDTIVAVGPADREAKSPLFEAVAIDMGGARDRIALDAPIERGADNWQNHVRGVLHALGQLGYAVKPARIAIAGDIPMGAGLASSAALGVAVALAVSEHSGLSLAPATLARVAHLAETDFVNAACGIMDHMASACSEADNTLLLDCRNLQHMSIPLHRRLAITVIDSGVRRDGGRDDVGRRRTECAAAARHYGVKVLRDLEPDRLELDRGNLDDVLYRRARHVVSEIGRVEPLAVALATGDTAALAETMSASHRSLRDDFEVSQPPIDRLADLLKVALGNSGGVRLTGAGFGGCLVAVCEREASPAIIGALARYNRDAPMAARSETFRASHGAAPIMI